MAATRASRVPYLEIAAEIREQIRSGRLMPGDKLRTVRSLAADYSVAQGTVGAAMEVLRTEGLVDTVQGKGSVVVAVPGETSADPDLAKLSAEVAELREMVRDYAELREMVRDHDVMLEDLAQRVPGPHVQQQRGASEEREREQLG
jgi:DNA-binding GntR family transcriptional regulator